MMRRSRAGALAVAGATAAALLLSGCAAGQISQTADQVAAIDGANGDAGRISVRNATIGVMTGGYQAGSDAPLLVTLTNDGIDADTLTSVSSSAAASVQIDGKAVIPPQSLVSVTDTSTIKLTLKGLKNALVYGFSVPITFSFATAGTISVNVPIAVPAGRGSSARPTADIQLPEATPLWLSGQVSP